MNETVAVMADDNQSNFWTSQSADIKMSKDDVENMPRKQIKLKIIYHTNVNSSCPVMSGLFVYILYIFVYTLYNCLGRPDSVKWVIGAFR